VGGDPRPAACAEPAGRTADGVVAVWAAGAWWPIGSGPAAAQRRGGARSSQTASPVRRQSAG